MALRKRFVAVPAVAAFATTATTALLLAPAAAAGTVPVVTTTCPQMRTFATFEPGNAVSGNVTVTSWNGADRDNEGEGLFLLEAGMSRPFTLAVNLGAKTHMSQVFSSTATGTSLRACLLQTSQGGGEENIGTVSVNVTK
jgi:ABC-type transport system substrate-binding protein